MFVCVPDSPLPIYLRHLSLGLEALQENISHKMSRGRIEHCGVL